jgi:hypothetical protein
VAECLPEFVEPMLLTATREVPSTPGWALEVKWDGIRAQLRFDAGRVTVRSRSGRGCTGQFPELQAIAAALGDQALFDGELVCFDDQACPTSSGCARGFGRADRSDSSGSSREPSSSVAIPNATGTSSLAGGPDGIVVTDATATLTRNQVHRNAANVIADVAGVAGALTRRPTTGASTARRPMARSEQPGRWGPPIRRASSARLPGWADSTALPVGPGSFPA